MQNQGKKRGRPMGALAAPVDQVKVILPRCRVCGSTERTPYMRREEQAYRGVDEAGQPYTHIVRRWTKCLKCGQTRIERSYELREPEKTDKNQN